MDATSPSSASARIVHAPLKTTKQCVEARFCPVTSRPFRSRPQPEKETHPRPQNAPPVSCLRAPNTLTTLLRCGHCVSSTVFSIFLSRPNLPLRATPEKPEFLPFRRYEFPPISSRSFFFGSASAVLLPRLPADSLIFPPSSQLADSSFAIVASGKRPDYKRPDKLFYFIRASRARKTVASPARDIPRTVFSLGRVLFVSLVAANRRFRWLSGAP